MSKEIDLNDDELEVPSNLKSDLMKVGLLFTPTLICSLIGQVQWQQSQVFQPVSLILRYSFFMAVLFTVLVGPIAYFAYPELKKIKYSAVRVIFLILFLSPPLLSYGYFIGQFKLQGQVEELFWSVMPGVVILSILFERTKNLWLLSFGIGSLCFFNFYLVGDILGPFPVLFHTIPKSEVCYLIKKGMSLLALGLVLIPIPKTGLKFSESY